MSCRRTIPKCGSVKTTKSRRRRIMELIIIIMLWKMAVEVVASCCSEPFSNFDSNDHTLLRSCDLRAAGWKWSRTVGSKLNDITYPIRTMLSGTVEYSKTKK